MVMVAEIEDRLWSVQDVSEYLGVPVHTIYSLRSAGTGPPGRMTGDGSGSGLRTSVTGWRRYRRGSWREADRAGGARRGDDIPAGGCLRGSGVLQGLRGSWSSYPAQRSQQGSGVAPRVEGCAGGAGSRWVRAVPGDRQSGEGERGVVVDVHRPGREGPPLALDVGRVPEHPQPDRDPRCLAR